MALLQFKQAYRAAGFELDRRRAARPPVRRARVRRHRRPGRRPAAAARPPGRAGAAAAGAARRRLTVGRRARGGLARRCRRCAATSATPSRRSPPRARRRRRSGSRRSPPPEFSPGPAAPTARPPLPMPSIPRSPLHGHLPVGGRPLRLPGRRSSSGTSGATATTSSAGPPAPPSSTRTGCCASAARCSTSGCSVVVGGHVDRPADPAVVDRGGRHQPRRPTTSSRSPAAPSPASARVVGMAILIYRRRTVGPVFSATTRNGQGRCTPVLGDRHRPGHVATPSPANLTIGGDYDYREGVSVWFRGIFLPSRPTPDLMARGAARVPAARAGRVRRCSRCGRSPAWCTSSARRSATSPGPTSSTAAATTSSAVIGRGAGGTASPSEGLPSIGLPDRASRWRSGANERDGHAGERRHASAPEDLASLGLCGGRAFGARQRSRAHGAVDRRQHAGRHPDAHRPAAHSAGERSSTAVVNASPSHCATVGTGRRCARRPGPAWTDGGSPSLTTTAPCSG